MEILIIFAFCWFCLRTVGLAFKVAWGTAKIIASILLAIAGPVLILCLMFAGGVVLLLPVAMIGAAFGLLKRCV